jgi:hypothetical protein
MANFNQKKNPVAKYGVEIRKCTLVPGKFEWNVS